MMNLDWPKFSAYQMRAMQNEPAAGPKPVGGDPRIIQWSKPTSGQGVGGAVYRAPESLPRAVPLMTGGGSAAPAPNSWLNSYMANGGVMPPEAPAPAVNMSAMRGNPTSTVGYSMGKASSAPRAFGAPFSVPPSSAPLAEATGMLPKFGSALGAIGKVAGPVGIAVGSYNATSEMLDPNSAPRQRFSAAGNDVVGGSYGSAAKNAYYGVGDVVGTFTGLKPLSRMIAGSDAPPPISYDAKTQAFSRAPTTRAEYEQMMAAKAASMPAATLTTRSDPAVAQAYGNAAPNTAPAQSYNDWLMKQPVSKLNATDYANRAQMEIDRRAPELLQQNIMKAAAYDLAHPEMVTSETHHRDGSWSKTYGDRSKDAMTGYSTFRDVLSKEPYYNSQAQAALTKADNSEKFTKADAVNLVGSAQERVMGALFGDESIPAEIKLQQAKAYFPTYAAALKQNGIEPPDFDTWLETQYGVAKGAGGFYSKPK